jgi:hypothetical protein
MINRRHFLGQKDQGMALVLVLIFTAALMILGTALIYYAVNEKLIANLHVLDIRLYYIAEAGAEAGIALLQEEFGYKGTLNGTVGGGSYAVTFHSIDKNCRNIVSVGQLNGYSRTISVSMELKGESEGQSVVVRQWLNPKTGH